MRTGWLYGGDKTHSKNFVYKRFLEASKNEVIYSDNTQMGNPTYVIDFVKQIEVLLEKRCYGIFNCINAAKSISRYDYVKRIVELFDINCNVEVASSDMFKRIAPVAKNESAINYKLDLLNLNVMREWQEALNEYIEVLKKEV